jgi:hypothetical protein
MLEEFREQANTATFFEEEEEPEEEAKRIPIKRKFLGMTALQRFLIALMLLLMTCIMGAFFLVVTGRVLL